MGQSEKCFKMESVNSEQRGPNSTSWENKLDGVCIKSRNLLECHYQLSKQETLVTKFIKDSDQMVHNHRGFMA